MNVTAIKTEKIVPDSGNLLAILDKYLLSFKEKSVLAITSKIVAICEGNVVKTDKANKDDLIENEAELYFPRTSNKYNVTLTIKRSLLAASAGIDESNGNGYYVLWPKDPQKTANSVREYLCKRYSITFAGVIITDSRSFPLRWGTTGVSIAHSGFMALNDYIGKPDIFGRIMQMTKSNVADSLAESAVAVMGEGMEQTPLAVISDVPFVQFQNRNPTQEESSALSIDIHNDIYAPLLTAVHWKKKRVKRNFQPFFS
jgi:dihydrofolate synthase / folylpolyglutamate synthase